MTPLGSSTWRLMTEQNSTPVELYGRACDLWDSHGRRASLYASRFSAAAMVGYLATTKNLDPVSPRRPNRLPDLPGVTSEENLGAADSTWLHVNSLVTSFDIDVPDPTIESELDEIALSHGALGILWFTRYGYMSISALSRETPDVFEDGFKWVERQLEILDARLWV